VFFFFLPALLLCNYLTYLKGAVRAILLFCATASIFLVASAQAAAVIGDREFLAHPPRLPEEHIVG
jgi:hypothetical protein